MRHFRDDVPPELQANYALTALLCGGLGACETILGVAKSCEASDRLRADIAAYRKSLSLGARIKTFFTGGGEVEMPLPFKPGVLVGGTLEAKPRAEHFESAQNEREPDSAG